MGGYGSGRWQGYSKADTVEVCRSLDGNRWMREGILKAGVWQNGGWYWFRDAARTEQTASIGYEVDTTDEAPWVRLYYTRSPNGEEVDYRVSLTATRPRFGGSRWWFICPIVVNGRPCSRRVGKLYLPPGGRYFGCRRCYRLTYASCQESRKFDGIYRLMAGNLGWDFQIGKQTMNQIGKRR